MIQPPEKLTTNKLVEWYQQDKQTFLNTVEYLQQRAVDESGFKVGDIVRIVPEKYVRSDDDEHVIVELVGKIEDYKDDGTVDLRVQAVTRKYTQDGNLPATLIVRHFFEPVHSTRDFVSRWEVIGHKK